MKLLAPAILWSSILLGGGEPPSSALAQEPQAPPGPAGSEPWERVLRGPQCYYGLLALEGRERNWLTWDRWWKHNRDPYLPRFPRECNFEDHLSRRCLNCRERNRLGPAVAHLQEDVLPALLRHLAEAPDSQDTGRCLLAIAEASIHLRDGREELSRTLLAHLAQTDADSRNDAILALGVFRDESVALPLLEIFLDSPEGRARTGVSPVPPRDRIHAAYALAIVAHHDFEIGVALPIARAFAETAARASDEEAPDLAVACVIGLGLIPPVPRASASEASFDSDAQFRFLRHYLADGSRPRLARAHVPLALARIAARDRGPKRTERRQQIHAALRPLLELPPPDIDLTRGAVLALGELGAAGDDRVDRSFRALLTRGARHGGDRDLRGFSLIGLARLPSGRGSDPPPGAEVLDHVTSVLLAALEAGDPWAALAVGVFGHALREEDPDDPRVPSLIHALRATEPPDAGRRRWGAWAIGLALLGDSAGTPRLLEHLDQASDTPTTRHLLDALAILNAPEAIGPITSALFDRWRYSEEKLEAGASTLRRLGATPPLARLVERTSEDHALFIQAYGCMTLGLTGDRLAVAPLVKVMEDRERDPRLRGFAGWGLALVTRGNTPRFHAPIANGINYRAAVPTLTAYEWGGILERY